MERECPGAGARFWAEGSMTIDVPRGPSLRTAGSGRKPPVTALKGEVKKALWCPSRPLPPHYSSSLPPHPNPAFPHKPGHPHRHPLLSNRLNTKEAASPAKAIKHGGPGQQPSAQWLCIGAWASACVETRETEYKSCCSCCRHQRFPPVQMGSVWDRDGRQAYSAE